MGELLRESLQSSGWLIVNTTPLPLVCFTREGLNTSKLLFLPREHQIAWMSEADLGGTPVVRACITSFKTTEADIHLVVGEMNRLIDQDARQTGSEQDSAVPAHAVNG
jgi:hypothetical protein